MIIKTENIPLFTGMTQPEMDEVTKDLKIHHHKRGSVIVERGTECVSLVILVDGWIEAETTSYSGSYRMVEAIQAPQILEPDKLFGISHSYHTTYRAINGCESIVIPKTKIMSLFEKHLVVRLNMLNIICRRAQIMERLPWSHTPQDVIGQIVQFVKKRCLYPAGKKTLYITMKQLAEELNINRDTVSEALNTLADKERIILKRGKIEIPALQLLLQKK